MRRGSYISPYARAAFWTGRFDLSGSILGMCAGGDAVFIAKMLTVYNPYTEVK